MNATANTEVILGSSMGNIAPVKVTIEAGECCAEARLTSAHAGSANVTAHGPGLKSTRLAANFLFPWMMVFMAALGGIIGALLHGRKMAFSTQWLRAVLPGIVLGLIWGVIFSIAALFGVIGSLPKLGLPIQVSQIPSGNELGALLLGFVGGFYGKKIWTRGADESEDDSKKKKTAAQPA